MKRKCFNVWVMEIFCDWGLFKAILRHGIFDTNDRELLADAIIQEREMERPVALLPGPRASERRLAIRARKNYKEACGCLRDLQKFAIELSSHQYRLLMRLQSGELFRISAAITSCGQTTLAHRSRANSSSEVASSQEQLSNPGCCIVL